jgi:hypothetical protein
MKKKLLLASIGIMGLFLLMPFAQAASSQVWFSDTTQIVWRYTEEALDSSMQVTSLNSSYRMMNFTDVTDNPNNISIDSTLHTATTADVTAHGFEDPTIWTPEGFSISGEIVDGEIETHFMSFFNELNTDLTAINGLPADNKTMMVLMMGVFLDPMMLATFFVWAFAHAFAATFGHDVNSSTITTLKARELVADIVLDFSIDDSGHWNNITYSGHVDLTYGKTSNVLLESICTSTLTASEWNGTAYESESMNARFTHTVAYPTDLVNDYPATIPGYSVWILVGAMVLGIIPAYLIVKRKKK